MDRHACLRIARTFRVWLAALAVPVIFYAPAAAAEAFQVTGVQASGPNTIVIYVSFTGHMTFSVAYADGPKKGQAAQFYEDTGTITVAYLSPSTSYSFKVCAVFVSGEGKCVTTAPTQTNAAATPPATPNSPTITRLDATADSITVEWQPNGNYDTILLHLSDPQGNVDQRTLASSARSFFFPGLRTGVRYRVILKGCKGACGPWSPDMFVETAAPPPPPLPPLKVTLNVSRFGDKAVRLDYSANRGQIYDDAKFVVYRDGKQAFDWPAGIIGKEYGWHWVDYLNTPFEVHQYKVCFIVAAANVNGCSPTVRGPKSEVLDAKPAPIEKTLPKLPYETYKDRKLKAKP